VAQTDDPIFERIKALPSDEAMEAALTLQDAFGLEVDAGHGDAYVAEVAGAPDAHVSEVEDLARLVLLAGAVDPDLRPTVEEALDAVGQRNFILGGAEIVALAAIGAFVFTSVQSGGKASEEETLHVKKDGSLDYHNKTVYVAGSGVMEKLLGWLRRP
jgi:hypothetical protein